jgi:hypothetical protein
LSHNGQHRQQSRQETLKFAKHILLARPDSSPEEEISPMHFRIPA